MSYLYSPILPKSRREGIKLNQLIRSVAAGLGMETFRQPIFSFESQLDKCGSSA